ncbi:MAG: hypothetical protein AAF432_00535 [Planctomycetota bacterium]
MSRKPAHKLKDMPVNFRATKAEYEAWVAQAEALDISFAEFARRALNEKCKRRLSARKKR